jgi:hypothetical protein
VKRGGEIKIIQTFATLGVFTVGAQLVFPQINGRARGTGAQPDFVAPPTAHIW